MNHSLNTNLPVLPNIEFTKYSIGKTGELTLSSSVGAYPIFFLHSFSVRKTGHVFHPMMQEQKCCLKFYQLWKEIFRRRIIMLCCGTFIILQRKQISGPNLDKKIHSRQERIPVGWVPPACCPYLPACTAPRPGGVPAQVLPPVNRILDTRYWKYHLAPNFVCGR